VFARNCAAGGHFRVIFNPKKSGAKKHANRARKKKTHTHEKSDKKHRNKSCAKKIPTKKIPAQKNTHTKKYPHKKYADTKNTPTKNTHTKNTLTQKIRPQKTKAHNKYTGTDILIYYFKIFFGKKVCYM